MSERHQRRGRPPAEEPSYAVSTWLRESEHVQVMRVAKADGVSVSEVIRQAVRERLERAEGQGQSA